MCAADCAVARRQPSSVSRGTATRMPEVAGATERAQESTIRVDTACLMLPPVRAMMRWSALLPLLAVGACGSTAKPGPDGGGGSNAGDGGRGGTTGSGG